MERGLFSYFWENLFAWRDTDNFVEAGFVKIWDEITYTNLNIN